MTFRVFFCAGVCGLLPSGGRFGTNAAGLSCPGDFFGAGTAWSSLTFPALFLRCFFEQICLGQSGLFRTVLQAFLWNGHWLK